MNQLVTFVQVAKSRSLSEGARNLGRSKSTVSAQISALEDRLGLRLFRRTTRKLALTSEGQDLLNDVEPAVLRILEVDQQLAEKKGTFAGHIKVSAPLEIPHQILAKTLHGFVKKHPGVSCELSLTNQMSDFVDDGVDLAIRGGEPVGQDTLVQRIGYVVFAYFASPNYVAVNGNPKLFTELQKHSRLGLIGSEFRLNTERRGKPLVDWSTQGAKISSDSMQTTIELAKLGAGIAMVPSYLCQSEIECGLLVPVLAEEANYISPLSLQYPSRREATPMIRSLGEKIRSNLLSAAITVDSPRV